MDTLLTPVSVALDHLPLIKNTMKLLNLLILASIILLFIATAYDYFAKSINPSPFDTYLLIFMCFAYLLPDKQTRS